MTFRDAAGHPDGGDLTEFTTGTAGDASKNVYTPGASNFRKHPLWQYYEIPFKTSTAKATLIFESQTDSDYGSIIDAVSVSRAAD